LKRVMNLEASGRVETLHQNDLRLSDVSLLTCATFPIWNVGVLSSCCLF